MKNTEIGFYSFIQFGYVLLNIGGNGSSAEVFRLFPMYLKDKVFKYLKKQVLSWQCQVLRFICTEASEETMAMIIMTENQATKIIMSKMI